MNPVTSQDNLCLNAFLVALLPAGRETVERLLPFQQVLMHLKSKTSQGSMGKSLSEPALQLAAKNAMSGIHTQKFKLSCLSS